MAVAGFEEVACVAVTVHGPATLGARNNPALFTLPQLAVQVTEAFAVNCWVCPSGVLAVPGVTASAAKTMEFVAVIALFAASVAVTVSVPADAGAV
jgi:hypothetical protein